MGENMSRTRKRNLSAATVAVMAAAGLFLGAAPASAATYCGPGQSGFLSGNDQVLHCAADLKTTVPSISGTVMQGMTLKAAPGSTWRAPVGKGFPVEPLLTYQWQRNGAAIAGARASTYKLTAADVGRKITVTMLTNLFDGRLQISWTSAATGTVIAPTVLNVAKPTVRGLPAVGKTLSAGVGTWRVPPTRYSYQWLRNGIAVKGATGSTYRLTTADKGRRISVKVVAARTGYLSGSGLSGATTIVR
jgi:hypothetical protein